MKDGRGYMILGRSNTLNLPNLSRLLPVLLASAALINTNLSLADNEVKPIADVRIIVDISGSMKKNDPQNLRVPAAELLIDLLPQNSKAGIWTFGKYVNMLVKHDYVDERWKRQAKNQAKQINSIALYTNIGEAVEKASEDWSKPDPRYERSILLLTDGKVDIAKSSTLNLKEQQRIIQDVIPRLTASQVKVHSIALSNNADQHLMKQFALYTGGTFSVANSANDLMNIFLNAFDSAVPSEQVPLEGNKFNIDPSVKEFTALIFRAAQNGPTELISPDGIRFNNKSDNRKLKWLSTNAYDLITFKKPKPGQWRLKTDVGPASRVSIISDLSLKVDQIPANIVMGEKIAINIHLLEKGQEISNADFLKLVDIHVSQAQEGGKTWSAVLGGIKEKGVTSPGAYSAKFGKTIIPGNHEFTIIADGKTFQRKVSQKVTVYENLVNIEQMVIGEGGDKQFSLKIVPQPGVLDLEKTSVVINVQLPDQNTEDFTAQLINNEYWQYLFSPSSGAGSYSLTAVLAGRAMTGRDITLHRGPYAFDYQNEQVIEASQDPALSGDDTLQQELPEQLNDEPVATLPTPSPGELKAEAPVPPPETELTGAAESQPMEAPEHNAEDNSDNEANELDLMSLIAMLVGGNILLGGIGFGIYKFIKRPKKEEAESEVAKTGEKNAQDAKATPEAEVALDEEPSPLEAEDEDATVLASASEKDANDMDGLGGMDDLSMESDPLEPDINDSLLSLGDDDDEDDNEEEGEDLSTAVADELMDLDAELGEMDLGDSSDDSDDDGSMDDVEDLLDLDDDMDDDM